MRFTFTFNGISNEDMGVVVPNRPPLSSPRRRMQFSNVDGKYGSTSFDMGHEVYTTEFEIVVDSEDVMDSVLAWLRGPGKFTRSDRPGMYQNVYIKDDLHFAYIADHGDNRLYRGTLKLLALDVYWYRDGWFKPFGGNKLDILSGYVSAGEFIGNAPIDVLEEGYIRNHKVDVHVKEGTATGVEEIELYPNNGKTEVKIHLPILSSKRSIFRVDMRIVADTYNDLLRLTVNNIGSWEMKDLIVRSGGDTHTYSGPGDRYVWVDSTGEPISLEFNIDTTSVSNPQRVVTISWEGDTTATLRTTLNEGSILGKYQTPWEYIPMKDRIIQVYEYGKLQTRKEGNSLRVITYGMVFSRKYSWEIPTEPGKEYLIRYDIENRGDVDIGIFVGPLITVIKPGDSARGEAKRTATYKNMVAYISLYRHAGVEVDMDVVINNLSIYESVGDTNIIMDKVGIFNEGTTTANPIIKLTKNKDSKAIVKIGSKTLEYNFPEDESEVYIDTKELKVYNSKGERRDIYFSTFEFPELPPGPTVVDNRSDVEVEFKHKDAWL